MIATRTHKRGNTPSDIQGSSRLPFSITNIKELIAAGHVQSVIDAGSDHMVAISREVVDVDYDGKRFTLVAGLYGPSGRQIQRYANVYYSAAARSQAETICCTISALRAQQLTRLRQPVRLAWDTDTASIWVTDERSRVPDVVGETRTTNVTYFDVASQKEPNEFARVIAHEWGHLALPAARGFTSPEPDSAGHLGEALGLKWLASVAPADQFQPIVPARGYIAQSRRKFDGALDSAIPGTSAFTKRNSQGMFAYIGAVLSVADAYGEVFLGRVFQAVDADTPDAFLTAMAFVIEEDGFIRVSNRAWVPLEAGIYTASQRISPSNVKGPAAVSCDANLRVFVRRSGWYLMIIPASTGLILRRKGR